MDSATFKALADATRRELLDRLFVSDGQTLNELCAGMDATRQAVTKHLKILEQAQLVTVIWRGREKHHYLNPVPIQGVADRWIGKFQTAQIHALGALKSALEGASTMSKPSYAYETYIHASADRIWAALTQPEFTRQYFHQTAVESDWKTGSRVLYRMPDGSDAVEGEVLESSPPRRLVITWHPLYTPSLSQEPPSRVTFEIEPQGELCRLTILHDGFVEGSQVYEQIRHGWSAIIASLKTLLETGKPLPVAGNEAEGRS